MIHSYLSHGRRVKKNCSFSTWKEVRKGVSQGSVLGPQLFKIFLNDLFLLMNRTEIWDYAHNITIYVCDSEVEYVIESLEQDAIQLSTWYPENYMKLIVDKCHLMIIGDKND